MYDELVRRLINCATQAAPCKTCDMTEDGSCSDTLMKQAADAIEKLLAERDEVNANSWKTAIEIERDEHRWIPVTERLFEAYEDVLLLFPNNQAAGFCDRDGCWCVYSGNGFYTEVAENETKPTHWARKLPEPPKEDKP